MIRVSSSFLGSIWFDLVCFRLPYLARFGSLRSLCFDLVWFAEFYFCSRRVDSVRFESVGFGSIRFGSVLFRWVWFGSVRFGLVWFGFVCFAATPCGSMRLSSVNFELPNM